MCDIKYKKITIAALCLTVFCAGDGFAQKISENRVLQPVFTSSSSHIEYQWNDPSYDYRLSSGSGARAPTDMSDAPETLDKHNSTTNVETELASKAKDHNEDQQYAERILEKIPYSKQLKSTWKVIDGDVDLFVKGLRMDRGNKGIEYKTDYVPFMGSVEGVMFKAEVGQESKMKLESSHIPFVGNIEGFKFKTSMGEDSSVSVRYNVSLDKLGL